MLSAPEVPATTGITPFFNPDTKAVFIDINNLNIDLDADTLTPTAPITFELTLPEVLRGTTLTHTVLSPEPGVSAIITPLDSNRVSVTLSLVRIYASLMLTAVTQP